MIAGLVLLKINQHISVINNHQSCCEGPQRPHTLRFADIYPMPAFPQSVCQGSPPPPNSLVITKELKIVENDYISTSVPLGHVFLYNISSYHHLDYIYLHYNIVYTTISV